MLEPILAFTILARIILGGAFLWAAIAKSRSLTEFQHVLVRSGYVAVERSRTLALSVIIAEIAVGLLLLSGVALRLAAVVALAMLVAFTVHLTVRINRRDVTPCSCFGSSETSLIHADLIRNLLLLFMATFIIMYSGHPGLFSLISPTSSLTSGNPATNFAAIALAAYLMAAWVVVRRLLELCLEPKQSKS